MKLIKVMINFYPVFRLGTLKCTVKPLLTRKGTRSTPLLLSSSRDMFCFIFPRVDAPLL